MQGGEVSVGAVCRDGGSGEGRGGGGVNAV